jgi:lipoprotein-releasing system permease protein
LARADRRPLGGALPLPLVLALRYLKSTRRDAFTTFLSLVAFGAIAVGVAALVLALAALSGFQQVLRQQVLSRTPAMEVELPQELGPEDAAAAAETLQGFEGVTGVELAVRGQGWLVNAGRTAPVQLGGFSHDVPDAYPGAAGGASGLYLSATRASAWGLTPGAGGEGGDTVDLVSPRPTLTPMGPQPRVRSLPLAGVFTTEPGEEREPVLLPLEVAESLLGQGRRLLVVDTVTLDRALELEDEVAAALPAGSRVDTWEDLNRPLFFALELERVMLFLGVSLIVLVASLALLADLALIIAAKRRDLGVLLTLGARPETLRRAFLILGAVLALLGTAVGAVAGVGLSALFDRIKNL